MALFWHFLKDDEQLYVQSFTTRRVINGPATVFISPLDRASRRKALVLGPTDYIHIRDVLTGVLHSEIGPKRYFLQVNEEVTTRLKAIPLKSGEYVHIFDENTGTFRTELGEKAIYLAPTEQLPEIQTAIPLKNNQYVQIIDGNSGVVRTVRGEATVYLTPTEKLVQPVAEGVNLDENVAVLVRDLLTGQLQLVTDKQVFFPAAQQRIMEERKRIRLADHEAVIIKAQSGKYRVRRGTDAERAFFLGPYDQLVEQRWSTGIHKDKRELKIVYFDSRPKFMWYEFEVRTQDNVELVLGVTFFWQVTAIEQMLETTDDAPGDICSHARSSIIQAISQVSFERFLSQFNEIVRAAVLDEDQAFFIERGVVIHAMEVRSVACKDAGTQAILNEIIQETTNRLNRLQKQESNNEVRLQEIRGQIDAERVRGDLIEMQREHHKTEATTQGAGEAERLHAFLSGLGDDVSLADKLAVFNLLRKQDILTALSQGTARLYFTPADVDLRIDG